MRKRIQSVRDQANSKLGMGDIVELCWIKEKDEENAENSHEKYFTYKSVSECLKSREIVSLDTNMKLIVFKKVLKAILKLNRTSNNHKLFQPSIDVAEVKVNFQSTELVSIAFKQEAAKDFMDNTENVVKCLFTLLTGKDLVDAEKQLELCKKLSDEEKILFLDLHRKVFKEKYLLEQMQSHLLFWRYKQKIQYIIEVSNFCNGDQYPENKGEEINQLNQLDPVVFGKTGECKRQFKILPGGYLIKIDQIVKRFQLNIVSNFGKIFLKRNKKIVIFKNLGKDQDKKLFEDLTEKEELYLPGYGRLLMYDGLLKDENQLDLPTSTKKTCEIFISDLGELKVIQQSKNNNKHKQQKPIEIELEGFGMLKAFNDPKIKEEEIDEKTTCAIFLGGYGQVLIEANLEEVNNFQKKNEGLKTKTTVRKLLCYFRNMWEHATEIKYSKRAIWLGVNKNGEVNCETFWKNLTDPWPHFLLHVHSVYEKVKINRKSNENQQESKSHNQQPSKKKRNLNFFLSIVVSFGSKIQDTQRRRPFRVLFYILLFILLCLFFCDIFVNYGRRRLL